MNNLSQIFQDVQNSQENYNFLDVLEAIAQLSEREVGNEVCFSLKKLNSGTSARYVLLIKDHKDVPEFSDNGLINLQGRGVRASLKVERYGENLAMEQRPYMTFLDSNCQPIDKPEILSASYAGTHCPVALDNNHEGIKVLSEFLSQFASDHPEIGKLFNISDRDKKVLSVVKCER